MPKDSLQVLVVGSGGREHTLGWKVAKSPIVSKVYFAPGNAGTADVGENVNIGVGDFEALKQFCVDKSIGMVVVGPEVPLCDGIHDSFEEDARTKDVAVIGPKKAGAKLEASKEFSKQIMAKYNVPTAKYQSFTKDTVAAGHAFLETLKAPYVLKADGLAAGKGVLIVPDLKQAKADLTEMLTGKFGGASATVVVEEFLHGNEFSVFVLIDTKGNFKILPTATDFKRAHNGDRGLNTGGMGAISPSPYCMENHRFMNKVTTKVVEPMVKGMIKEGLGYTGFLYCGLMRCGDEPYVIEFNCRMGDPETEAVIPRIQNDLVPLLRAVKTGKLDQKKLTIDPRPACTVVLCAGGYPESYAKGKPISGLDAPASKDMQVFYAGVKQDGDAKVSNGGRVLAVNALGNSANEAHEKAYERLSSIKFEDSFHRTDIGIPPIFRMPGGGKPPTEAVLRALQKRGGGPVTVTGNANSDAAGLAAAVASEACISGAETTKIEIVKVGKVPEVHITLMLKAK